MKFLSIASFMVLSLLMVSSCNKKDEVITPERLTGTWQEQETDGSFAGTTFRITFQGDGNFTSEIKFYTDAVDTAAPCYKQPLSYVKGQYTVTGSTIRFTGVYTDPSYQTPQPNCMGATAFSQSYVSAIDGSKLTLNCTAGEEWSKIKLYKQQ